MNLQSLSKSIGALHSSIRTCDMNWGAVSEDMQETLRAGVIQNFEVAYEQSWKKPSTREPEKNYSELPPVKV